MIQKITILPTLHILRNTFFQTKLAFCAGLEVCELKKASSSFKQVSLSHQWAMTSKPNKKQKKRFYLSAQQRKLKKTTRKVVKVATFLVLLNLSWNLLESPKQQNDTSFFSCCQELIQKHEQIFFHSRMTSTKVPAFALIVTGLSKKEAVWPPKKHKSANTAERTQSLRMWSK